MSSMLQQVGAKIVSIWGCVDNAGDFLNNAQFDALKRSLLDNNYSFSGDDKEILSPENFNHTVSNNTR